MRLLLSVLCVALAGVAVWAHSEKARRDLQVQDLRGAVRTAEAAARTGLGERDAARAEVARLQQELEAARGRHAEVEAQRATAAAEAKRSGEERDAARARGASAAAERDAALAREQAALRRVETATKEGETLAGHVRRLEASLHQELERHKAIDAKIEATAEALREERERHKAAMEAARKFMPEGVRQALLALNECLEADGQAGMRFMRASRIEDSVLHDVQLLDYDPRTLISKVYLSKQLTFHLDRKAGALTLLFKEGVCSGPGGRREFAADGERLVLPGVDGARWETKLPYLVQATGGYPLAKVEAPEPVMPAQERVAWAGRLNKLLDMAKTEIRYRVETFRDLASGRFEDALLLGYDGRRLATSVEAKAMWVRIDERRAAVELHVGAGILRNAGGETGVPDGGYRIQLPGVTPKQAEATMLGMVVRR